MEYLFVGHPSGALHVAWNDGPDWDINPHFVGQVKKVASMNRPVVLICRSGHRSVDAGLFRQICMSFDAAIVGLGLARALVA